MKRLAFALLTLALAASSSAQTTDSAVPSAPDTPAAREVPARKDERPIVWPTVRYGWPEKWSVGAAFQPRLPGVLNRLMLTGTVGTGGRKAGLGYGWFGGNLMAGTAVHVTLLRTTSHPHGAEPHQTFIGVEPQIMLANFSFKGGPAVRIGGRTHSADQFRINFSVGIGF
jgi:hypothetical protein